MDPSHLPGVSRSGPWNLCDLGRLTVKTDQKAPNALLVHHRTKVVGRYIYRPTILHVQRAISSVPIFTDQQYCTVNVQTFCTVTVQNVCTVTVQNVVDFGRGSWQFDCWQLAVGSWLLAAGSCLDNLILLLYWDIRTRNSKVRRDILTHQTDIHKLQIYI